MLTKEKLKQNPDIHEYLSSTGDSYLLAKVNNQTWAIGRDSMGGGNDMGTMWMVYRDNARLGDDNNPENRLTPHIRLLEESRYESRYEETTTKPKTLNTTSTVEAETKTQPENPPPKYQSLQSLIDQSRIQPSITPMYQGVSIHHTTQTTILPLNLPFHGTTRPSNPDLTRYKLTTSQAANQLSNMPTHRAPIPSQPTTMQYRHQSYSTIIAGNSHTQQYMRQYTHPTYSSKSSNPKTNEDSSNHRKLTN